MPGGETIPMEETFRTLRGFLAGEEPDEKTYFAYSATLRIFGDGVNFNEITARLGLQPTTVHRKGEKPDPRHAGYRHDMWSYTPSLDKARTLAEHIDALWKDLKPHKGYLIGLKKSLEVDVFLGYRSNCDNAGIEVRYKSLEIYTELEIPFGVSIIIT